MIITRQGSVQGEVDAGDLAGALAQASRTWASLPGSPYGQRTNTLAALTDAFLAAGGTLAT